MTSLVAVAAAKASCGAAANKLAEHLSLPLVPPCTDPRICLQHRALLVVGEQSLCLQQTGAGAPGPITVDFGSATMRHRRRGGANELLGRAVGIGKKTPLRVLDGTAGLGTDSFVLADLGCEVLLCERNPVVAALLQSGMRRAGRSEDAWLVQVAQRMQLRIADVRDLTAAELAGIDVIYLDPMYPQSNRSAAVKKEMALFQALLQPTNDSTELLAWARQRDVARVVVKRPPRGPVLADSEPSHCIRGKAVRYDVYVNRGLG